MRSHTVKRGNEYLVIKKNTVMFTLETMQLSRSSGFSNETFYLTVWKWKKTRWHSLIYIAEIFIHTPRLYPNGFFFRSQNFVRSRRQVRVLLPAHRRKYLRKSTLKRWTV